MDFFAIVEYFLVSLGLDTLDTTNIFIFVNISRSNKLLPGVVVVVIWVEGCVGGWGEVDLAGFSMFSFWGGGLVRTLGFSKIWFS